MKSSVFQRREVNGTELAESLLMFSSTYSFRLLTLSSTLLAALAFVACDDEEPEPADGEAVAACEKLADEALQEGCDEGRNCHYKAFRKQCASGRTEAVEKAFRCIVEGQTCSTAYDPGNAEKQACYEEVTQEYASENSEEARERMEELCGEDSVGGAAFLVGLTSVLVSKDTAEEILDCVKTESTCETALEKCLSLPSVGFQCD